MRKAFDANVPKLKPRLGRNGSPGEEGGARPLVPAREAPATAARASTPAAAPTHAPGSAREPALGEPGPSPREAVPAATRIAEAMAAKVAAEPAEILGDLEARRARLEKIKRRVAEAARERPRVEAPPETPARAAESVLGMARELEQQLSRSRDAQEALRADLAQARADLTRGAAEARGAAERLSAAEREVEEKRAMLGELLGELSALEEERDRAVERAQALGALDEERQQVLDALSARAEASEKARDEAREEARRLAEDLDLRLAEGARLRAALAEVTRERDELARELDRARRERGELAEARRALEQVHQALATARSRIG